MPNIYYYCIPNVIICDIYATSLTHRYTDFPFPSDWRISFPIYLFATVNAVSSLPPSFVLSSFVLVHEQVPIHLWPQHQYFMLLCIWYCNTTNGRRENRNTIICIGEIRDKLCLDHCRIPLKVTNINRRSKCQ